MLASFSCPLCKTQYSQPIDQHLAQGCPLRQSISHIGKTFIICEEKHYCLRCLSQFSKEEWQYHRKKIRTQCPNYQSLNKTHIASTQMDVRENNSKQTFSTPSKLGKTVSQTKNSLIQKNSSLHKGISINQTNYYYPSMQRALKFSEVVQVNQRQKLVLLFIQIFISKSKIVLLQWIQTHKSIKNIHLQLFFNKYIDKALEMLKLQIKQPSFQLLNSNYKTKWSQLLEEATDIFDKNKVLAKISNLKPTVRLKVLRCINSIYKNYYADVFQKFAIQTYQPLTSRDKLPIKTIDFLCFLEKLFKTKERDLVHIAIDLLLIFQSGQRFVSDRLNLQKGVQQMLQIRLKGDQCFEFQMIVNKTKKKVQVILGSQLCSLLQQFGWKRFYKSGLLYARLSQILGFGLYSLKRGLLNQYFLQEHNKINLDIKTLAGHSKITTTDIYTGAAKQWIKMQIKDRIKVPNLRIEQESQKSIQSKLGKTSKRFKKYVNISLNWFIKLKLKLKRYNKELVDFCSSSNQQKPTQQQMEVKQLLKTQKKSKLQSQMLIDDLKDEKVVILAKEYSFKNNKFNLSQLFTQVKQIQYQNCFQCKKQLFQGLSCLFCMSKYHFKCFIAFCSCTVSIFPAFIGLQLKAAKQCALSIYMLETFFGDFSKNQALNTIKFLTLARRFHYSTTQMQSLPLSHVPKDIPNLQSLQLPRFKQYQEGNYFPAVELRKSGDSSNYGTGFGLFATQPIPKLCFIGQYAADVVSTFSSMLIRKLDSIFDLNTNEKQQGLIIGPVFHCSYSCLINSSRQRKPNCKSLKVLLNGALRVIIYASRSISTGQQLHYDYEAGLTQSQSKDNLRPGIESNQKIISESKKQNEGNIKCGLINCGQSCYYNAVLQVLKMLPSTICQKKGHIASILAGLFSNMDSCNKVYNISKYIEFFERRSKGKFKKNQQNDAHQLLIFLFQNLDQTIKNDFLINIKAVDTCTSCSYQKISNIQCLTYNIQASEASIQQLFKGEQQTVIQDYKCCKCNKTVQLARKQSFLNYPQLFIVHLQRYKSVNKDRSIIKYSQLITPKYKLRSALIHIGQSVDRGHYKVLQFRNQALPILYDDELVYQTQQVFYKDCYLLFYQKVQE